MTARQTAFFALGTKNWIRIFHKKEDGAVREAVGRVYEIERRMSAFLPDSDLSGIRRKAGTEFQPVHEDTFRLLHKAVRFGALTDGAFDVTIHPLVRLWAVGRKGDFVPPEQEIRSALALVDYRTVQFDDRAESCRLTKRGQSIDLGGIAKGYAADEVRRILVEHGVRSALINLGGNLAAVGSRPDGLPWSIGVQHPLAPRGESVGSLSVTDRTVVTSGCNERFFIKDGIRYHHILDPRTGKPAQSSVLSVTVVGTDSAEADALATAFLILGPQKSAPLIRAFHVEAIFIGKNLSCTVTKGLEGNFHIFERN